MMSGLLKRLMGPSHAAPMPRDQARLALAALLVRLARADGDYAAIEATRIEAVFAREACRSIRAKPDSSSAL